MLPGKSFIYIKNIRGLEGQEQIFLVLQISSTPKKRSAH